MYTQSLIDEASFIICEWTNVLETTWKLENVKLLE